MPRLNEQKKTNLHDMSAGGDMRQIILMFGVKGVSTGEIVKGRVHLFKIPGITHLEHVAHHFRFRRHNAQIADHRVGYARMFPAV